MDRSSDTSKTFLVDPDMSYGFGQMWRAVVLLFLMDCNLSPVSISMETKLSQGHMTHLLKKKGIIHGSLPVHIFILETVRLGHTKSTK